MHFFTKEILYFHTQERQTLFSNKHSITLNNSTFSPLLDHFFFHGEEKLTLALSALSPLSSAHHESRLNALFFNDQAPAPPSILLTPRYGERFFSGPVLVALSLRHHRGLGSVRVENNLQLVVDKTSHIFMIIYYNTNSA